MTGAVHYKGVGRRRSDALAAAPHPHGRPAVWEALRRVGGGTIAEIASDAAVDQRTVRSYVDALHAGGFLRAVPGEGQLGGTLYLLRSEPPVPTVAPRLRPDGSLVTQGDGRERLWRTMKMLKTFSAQDLAVSASLPEAPIAFSEAHTYARVLHAAGYLAELKRGTPKGGLSLYRLVKNTGPQPPQIQRRRAVFDPNLGRVTWLGGAEGRGEAHA